MVNLSKYWVILRKKHWPINFHLNRCPAWWDGKYCHKLFWPWQEIISVDPECYSPRHHECYHKEVKWLYHDFPISQNEEPYKDWKDELWCNHEESK